MNPDDRGKLRRVLGTDGNVVACRLAADELHSGRHSESLDRSLGAIVRIDVHGSPVFATIVAMRADPDLHYEVRRGGLAVNPLARR